MAEKYTSRGFGIYAELTDEYGSKVRVQESSLATEECVWIFCENDHPQWAKTKVTPAPHLNREHARIVRDALTEFIGLPVVELVDWQDVRRGDLVLDEGEMVTVEDAVPDDGRVELTLRSAVEGRKPNPYHTSHPGKSLTAVRRAAAGREADRG